MCYPANFTLIPGQFAPKLQAPVYDGGRCRKVWFTTGDRCRKAWFTTGRRCRKAWFTTEEGAGMVVYDRRKVPEGVVYKKKKVPEGDARSVVYTSCLADRLRCLDAGGLTNGHEAAARARAGGFPVNLHLVASRYHLAVRGTAVGT